MSMINTHYFSSNHAADNQVKIHSRRKLCCFQKSRLISLNFVNIRNVMLFAYLDEMDKVDGENAVEDVVVWYKWHLLCYFFYNHC